MCAHRSLLLALVLNSLSHAFYSKGDINVISLRGLIKAISLFKSVKRRVFGYKSYKKRFTAFRLLIIRFFREKISETTLCEHLSGGGTLILC